MWITTLYMLKGKINMASRLCTRPFEYKVGEISQALLTKNATKKTGNYGNEKLDALFSSARSLQPEFVPITSEVRGHLWETSCMRDWCTMEPRYNEVSRYRKKCSLYRGLRYSEDPVTTNYLVNNKNVCYSGITKLNNGIYCTPRKTVFSLTRE